MPSPEQQKSPDAATTVELHPEVKRDIEKFVLSVKGRRMRTSSEAKPGEQTNLDVAKETAMILRKTLSYTKGKDTNIQTMVLSVREACKRMKEAYPYGSLISNVTRRVLYILRDEYQITKKEQVKETGEDEGTTALADLDEQEDEASSSVLRTFNPALDSQLASVPSMVVENEKINFFQLKNNIMEHLTNNFMHDFDDVYKNIQEQAPEHIAEGEVILTYGYSQTVEKFLTFAAKKVPFKVIVCEAAPGCNGHQMAKKLVEHGVQTTVIPDSLAHAYMSRAEKVILGTYLVVANGGLVAPAGTHGVAMAAQYHRVPVIVCAAMIKLTPIYPSTADLSESWKLRDPNEVIPFGAIAASAGASLCPTNWLKIVNASVDYVPPELIALFITNDDAGRAYAPSYVYRLLLQLYNPEDSDL